MPRKTYTKGLQHPDWQRKQLAILNRSELQCEDCHERGKTLQVHHCLHLEGREPWEYEDDELRALCQDCRDERQDLEHDVVLEFQRFLALLPGEELRALMPDLLIAQQRTKEGFSVSLAADYELVRNLPAPLHGPAIQAAEALKQATTQGH